MTRKEETLKEYLELIYRKNKYIVIVVALVILVFAVFIGLTITTSVNDKKTNQQVEDKEVEPIQELGKGEMESENQDVFVASNKLVEKKVYIVGEVHNPGVYNIYEGDRVEDVIKYAGGVTDEAYLQNINLSRIVDDEEHIIIPTKDDENINSVDSNVSNVNSNGKININKATKDELVKITGVGDTTADKIITHRTTIGKFYKIEDIKKVSGIGNKTFEKMKDEISV